MCLALREPFKASIPGRAPLRGGRRHALRSVLRAAAQMHEAAWSAVTSASTRRRSRACRPPSPSRAPAGGRRTSLRSRSRDPAARAARSRARAAPAGASARRAIPQLPQHVARVVVGDAPSFVLPHRLDITGHEERRQLPHLIRLGIDAVVSDDVTGPEGADHVHGFCEHLAAHGCGRPVLAEDMFVEALAGSDAEAEPAAEQGRARCGRLRQDRRMDAAGSGTSPRSVTSSDVVAAMPPITDHTNGDSP